VQGARPYRKAYREKVKQFPEKVEAKRPLKPL
jgi:hypothetical protein